MYFQWQEIFGFAIKATFGGLLGLFLGASFARAAADPAAAGAGAGPDFGPNVVLFDPSMAPAEIDEKCGAIFAQEETNQFGADRHALLFEPGAYQATVRVGYYTQVLGLGPSPEDTVISGGVNCDARWKKGNATLNFWRGCENLTIVPSPVDYDRWAVAQAAPFRRVHVKGSLMLFDGGWASGGDLSDCVIDRDVVAGTQQQWFSRNTDWASWTGGLWNMVFLGIDHPPEGQWPKRPYTTIGQTPVVAEKPYLYVDGAHQFKVFVPALRTDASGPSWNAGGAAGTSLSLDQFYVARADKDSAATINQALDGGKNLLLTPGIYDLDAALRVSRAGTVVLGLGLATLSPRQGTAAMEIADVDGVRIAGVLFDAGPVSSPCLLQVGEPGSDRSHAGDPTILTDIFARVGGAVVGLAQSAVIINSNDVIGDHAWLWRADHGAGAGWDKNMSDHGLIVNGSGVTFYGLFVEHFQKAQTVWKGENGRDYFYQCEMPYDPPTQDDWKETNARGWPGYQVGDQVKTHEAWGLGIYCLFKQDNIFADSAVECPKTSGVKLHDVIAVRLGGGKNSGIGRVVNGGDDAATKSVGKSMLMEYPAPAGEE